MKHRTGPAVAPLSYKVGDKSKSGNEIHFIFGHSNQVVVFLDQDDEVQWETAAPGLSPAEQRVNARYDELHSRLRAATCNDPQKERIKHALGQALFLALSAGSQNRAVAHFKAVDQQIRTLEESGARMAYVLAGVVAGVVIAGGIGLLRVVARDIELLALLSGLQWAVVGGSTSILQRAATLKVVVYQSTPYLRMQGISRTMIGAVGGALAFALVKSNMILGEFGDEGWTMRAVCFVAGCSERFVPELIRIVEDASTKDAPTRSKFD